MTTSRFNEARIMRASGQAEGGLAMPGLCREHGISRAPLEKCRAKVGDMDVSLMSQLKTPEDKNRRLKPMFTNLSLQAALPREALGNK